MKKIIFILLILFSFNNIIIAQGLTKNKKEITESMWDQGVPVLPEDEYISSLIDKVGFDNLRQRNKAVNKEEAKLCREIGIAFYNREMYEAADWYLERVRGFVEVVELEPEIVFETKKEETEEPSEDLSVEDLKSLQSDKVFLQNLPKSYENVSPTDMKKLAEEIEGQIEKLIKEKEELLKRHAPKEVIDAKDATIGSLGKEKKIIDLSIDKDKLKNETKVLGIEKRNLKFYLNWAIAIGLILILIIFVLIQRKTIKGQDKEIDKQLNDINTKNTYLEHAARIIRHDMHSGINTYIPRGISSLEKRLTVDDMKNLKIEGPIKMIREGLNHTQKVYKNVYEFTNLVKQNVVLEKTKQNIKNTLEQFFVKTSYYNQIKIKNLPTLEINEVLFCGAIENFVKNGLKYNNNENKEVLIFEEDNYIVVQDNGIGMTSTEFEKQIKMASKEDIGEMGLGLNISIAILKEHGFSVECEKNEIGTKIKIKFKS